jgi:hypothetical protein
VIVDVIAIVDDHDHVIPVLGSYRSASPVHVRFALGLSLRASNRSHVS